MTSLTMTRRARQLTFTCLRVGVAALAGASLSAPLGLDAAPLVRRAHDDGRKGAPTLADTPLLGTIVDTHSPGRVLLDELSPGAEAFEALLADPVLRATHPIDPALPALARALLRAHPGSHLELVSGYRSPKLNEALRKKGHHVASHSQHSLGHALDFRVVPEETGVPLDPVAIATEVRASGWAGGLGIYVGKDDRFVHADVGPERTWYGQ